MERLNIRPHETVWRGNNTADMGEIHEVILEI
jgi:hypothetical protein